MIGWLYTDDSYLADVTRFTVESAFRLTAGDVLAHEPLATYVAAGGSEFDALYKVVALVIFACSVDGTHNVLGNLRHSNGPVSRESLSKAHLKVARSSFERPPNTAKVGIFPYSKLGLSFKRFMLTSCFQLAIIFARRDPGLAVVIARRARQMDLNHKLPLASPVSNTSLFSRLDISITSVCPLC